MGNCEKIGLATVCATGILDVRYDWRHGDKARKANFDPETEPADQFNLALRDILAMYVDDGGVNRLFGDLIITDAVKAALIYLTDDVDGLGVDKKDVVNYMNDTEAVQLATANGWT